MSDRNRLILRFRYRKLKYRLIVAERINKLFVITLMDKNELAITTRVKKTKYDINTRIRRRKSSDGRSLLQTTTAVFLRQM